MRRPIRLLCLSLCLASLACTLGIAPASIDEGPLRIGVAPVSALTPTLTITPTRATTATQPATFTPAPTETPPPSPSIHISSTTTPTGGANQIAFHSGPVDGEKAIVVMHLDGTRAITLTTGISPVWSPDGARLAFVAARESDLDIFVMRSDGTGLTNLTQSRGNDDSPAWSPDGQFIVFSSQRDGNAELYQMRADGTDLVRLTTSPLAQEIQPAYAPDGGQIVFVSFQAGVAKLYRMQRDGSEAQALTDGPGQDKFPTWSPDGTRIAFASDRERAGVFELYELTLATNTLRRLTNSGTQNGSPHYSPDGQHLLFDSNRDGNYEVYRLNLETLGVTQLTRTSRPIFNGDPSWRP